MFIPESSTFRRKGYRGDAFFKQALGIDLLASSPTLRQRKDARASEMFDFVPRVLHQPFEGSHIEPGQ